ncbi:hypothetical protein D3C76_1455580 [compost metagenome]
MRAAYTRESTLVSAKETRATAQPPISTGTISALVIQGMANAGRPCGSVPSTLTPARAARSSTPTATVAPTTAIRIPGMRLCPLSSRITARVAAPTMNAVQLVLPSISAVAMAHRFLSGPSVSIEKPKNFGSWLINTVSAMPFM